jgi:hypothetical protein
MRSGKLWRLLIRRTFASEDISRTAFGSLIQLYDTRHGLSVQLITHDRYFSVP